ncbi:ferritin-like domain-containing protein [Synechococcus sp. PCC 7336]|uniref:ferritin-like domain-containing protein n=1 Tax=Synechococcus sp. PCC 7336 TaxID=195250 RepID=UPI000370D5EB|nr:ferritin-like domain-containing protein [Synechococcus sp. PCC 7336]
MTFQLESYSANPAATAAHPPDWSRWRSHFEQNRYRPFPEVETSVGVPLPWRAPLACALAKFQLGEAGEGRIAREIDRVCIDTIDRDYRVALKLFVAEEGRHGRILAELVQQLDGQLLDRSWIESGFVAVRRLVGIRLKLMVLLAAEVVGIAFYRLVAAPLEEGPARSALEEIVADEQHHLDFHCDFFRTQIQHWWGRAAFRVSWSLVVLLASMAAIAEFHRPLQQMEQSPLRLASHCLQLARQVSRAIDGNGEM